MKNLVSEAKTLTQLRDEIAEMARLYAWQEGAAGRMQKSKRKQAEHLQASKAIEILAEHIGQIQIATTQPVERTA